MYDETSPHGHVYLHATMTKHLPLGAGGAVAGL